ncbi:MAG: hypothetical protein ABIK28_20380 [Planctomycetota bacterium]
MKTKGDIKKLILIVEDGSDFAALLESTSREIGFSTPLACDGECKRCLKNETPWRPKKTV